MIKTVYLDMDGVITDFVGGVCRAFNKSNPYPALTRDYTFWNAWPEVSTKDVDAICNQEFWHNLEWVHDGRDILRAIMGTLGLEKVYLLTQPMPNLESASGKMMWVNNNLPIYLKRTIITTMDVPKSLLAKPDTLLIDDKDENVKEFVKAGGYGILINRPWNKGYERADHTVEDLEIDLLDIVHDVGVDR